MALVVETTSNAAGNNVGSVSITAPTGINTGDVLLIVACAQEVNTPTGFTRILNLTTTSRTRAFYKIAVLADETSSNYSVSFNASAGGGAATMLRISGWSSGDPLFGSTSNESTFSDGNEPTSVGQTGLTLKRPSAQLLVYISSVIVEDTTSDFSYSGYSITSSDSNPTWTEVIDTEVFYGANAAAATLAVAYANSSNTSTITAYSADLAESGFSTGIGSVDVALLIFAQPTNVEPYVSPLNVVPSVNSLVATNNVAADVPHLAVEPTINGLSSKKTPTPWSNPDKPNTNWNNLAK